MQPFRVEPLRGRVLNRVEDSHCPMSQTLSLPVEPTAATPDHSLDQAADTRLLRLGEPAPAHAAHPQGIGFR